MASHWKSSAAIAALIVAMAAPCRADDSLLGEWKKPTWDEAGWLIAAQTVLVIDVLQTLDIERQNRRAGREVFRETNPLLGDHPSTAKVLLVAGVGTAAFATTVWYALPPKARWVVPVVLGAVELAAVSHNAAVGLTLGF